MAITINIYHIVYRLLHSVASTDAQSLSLPLSRPPPCSSSIFAVNAAALPRNYFEYHSTLLMLLCGRRRRRLRCLLLLLPSFCSKFKRREQSIHGFLITLFFIIIIIIRFLMVLSFAEKHHIPKICRCYYDFMSFATLKFNRSNFSSATTSYTHFSPMNDGISSLISLSLSLVSRHRLHHWHHQ